MKILNSIQDTFLYVNSENKLFWRQQKCKSLRKTSGKHLRLKLSKRIRFVMKDHEEKREENAGMNFKDYSSVDGKKKNENQ